MDLFDKTTSASGITNELHEDSDGNIVQVIKQDAQHILDSNAEIRNSYAKPKDNALGEHHARIPMSIVMKWQVEDGIDIYNPDDLPRVMAKLNEPEYAFLRVNNKKHIIKG